MSLIITLRIQRKTLKRKNQEKYDQLNFRDEDVLKDI